MKCLICGEEVERSSFHFHLKKHNMKMKEYYVKFNFDFTKKDYLENEYCKNEKSLKQITKECEEKYNISNLKSTVLDFAKEFYIKKRTISGAGKLYFENNEIWNKGCTKKDNASVALYSKKKKELYKKVRKKLESLSISELLKFNIQQNKKIRNILRKKLIEKQDNICPICESSLTNLDKRLQHIHHIDRDNSNDTEENLIVLCASCHTKLSGHKHRLKELDFILSYDDFVNNLELVRYEISKIKKNKEDMMCQLESVDKFDKKKYYENIKENGKCSINISKLKLTEFIQ